MRTEFGADRGGFGITAKACLGRLFLSTPILQREIYMIPDDTHLLIGSLMFEGMDQIDLTGPFEALSRVPNSTYQIYAKTGAPVRDLNGLRLIPDAAQQRNPRARAAGYSGARQAIVSGDHRSARGNGAPDRSSSGHFGRSIAVGEKRG